MKNKLHIAGLVCITLLTYSCSNDDSYEGQEVKAKNFEITPQTVLTAKTIDSTTVKSGTKINAAPTSSAPDGDPVNPPMPR
ncbi:hypothetical protein [Flavobacterium sp. AED]|uniref:hypothetical protein n=1 Tax=Flavobacterium sp. AED TaxID=1423323 RepID=UPI0018CE99C4|nr:hypothetical protein [Flavobacterium sp. AED]